MVRDGYPGKPGVELLGVGNGMREVSRADKVIDKRPIEHMMRGVHVRETHTIHAAHTRHEDHQSHEVRDTLYRSFIHTSGPAVVAAGLFTESSPPQPASNDTSGTAWPARCDRNSTLRASTFRANRNEGTLTRTIRADKAMRFGSPSLTHPKLASSPRIRVSFSLMLNKTLPQTTGKSLSEKSPGPFSVFLVAACLGLITGLLEVAVLIGLWSYNSGWRLGPKAANRHYVWMIPVNNLLLFGICGLVLAGAAAVWPKAAHRVAAYVLVGL